MWQIGGDRSQRGQGGDCVDWVAVPIGTGSWGGKGGCRVSRLDFPTGAHASFIGCPC